jgi:hypothetical protein
MGDKSKQAGQILMKITEIRLKSLLFTTIYALIVTNAMQSPVSAQVKPSGKSPSKVSGDIDVELQVEKKDPYAATQELTLTYLKNLKLQLQSVSTTNKKIILPDSESINYLNGLYLFCTIKKGTCPAVLDTLFEIDLVNSRLNNTALCPLMKSFWKRYIENDFEGRLKYNTSTGFITKVNEFNAKERPRYLRCEDTLKDIFKEGLSPSALFSSRYGATWKSIKAVDEVIALITAVQEKHINVFVATGAQ